MGQVRLTDAVEQALQQRAIESGRSLAAEADVWLRRALGLAPGQKSPAALAHPAPGTASISAAKGPGVIGRPLRR